MFGHYAIYSKKSTCIDFKHGYARETTLTDTCLKINITSDQRWIFIRNMLYNRTGNQHSDSR